MNTGGLNATNKPSLGHTGVHFDRYNSVVERNSPSPSKEAPTHYYQSDGTGRDSYILMDNGGSRPEYDKYNKTPENIFQSSLRSGTRSPLKYKQEPGDRADITSYLNWKSS
jgi:hypothetical protein